MTRPDYQIILHMVSRRLLHLCPSVQFRSASAVSRRFEGEKVRASDVSNTIRRVQRAPPRKVRYPLKEVRRKSLRELDSLHFQGLSC
jgi:hypothetical protein